VCDKTCIFCFFPIINKYLSMAKRSLLSERPSSMQRLIFIFVIHYSLEMTDITQAVKVKVVLISRGD